VQQHPENTPVLCSCDMKTLQRQGECSAPTKQLCRWGSAGPRDIVSLAHTGPIFPGDRLRLDVLHFALSCETFRPLRSLNTASPNHSCQQIQGQNNPLLHFIWQTMLQQAFYVILAPQTRHPPCSARGPSLVSKAIPALQGPRSF
jgi:hypothetical protein